ncbi:MAG: beta-lactamase family protein [Balneolaceae bacterium]|nr:beta-lactamase family protein [Balneolaceae bacterium]
MQLNLRYFTPFYLLIFSIFAAAFTMPLHSTSKTGDELSLKIDEIFSEFDNSQSPGCAVSVFHNGEPVIQKNYGLANLDYSIPLSSSSSFYMASISKQFTAAALGLLILRGELSAEDLVSEYIEDWPEWAADVKISHLLNHTSGLPDIYGLMDIAGISLSNVMSIDDYVDVIRNGESLKHTTGTEYAYTNSGYTVLAAIIENVSDTPFHRFVHQVILEPLGMDNTHFHSSRHRVIPNRVISYAPGKDQFRQTYLSNFQGVGPGGLYSTHEDMAKWEMFWNRSDNSDELNELRSWLLTREILDDEPLDYAMGLQVSQWKGMNVTGHSGSFMGFKNDYRRYPDHGYSFLTLCNRDDANAIEKNRDLARLFLKESIESFIEPYSGLYYNEELDSEYELTVEDGSLILNRRLSPNGAMSEDSFDRWSAGSWYFEFQRDENDTITGFLLSTGRALDVEFVKR